MKTKLVLLFLTTSCLIIFSLMSNNNNNYNNEYLSKESNTLSLITSLGKEHELTDLVDIEIDIDDDFPSLDLPDQVPMGGNTDKYWFNIGTELPQAVDYSGTTLLSLLMPGDILYEPGFISHVAIVEGKFWSATYSQYYIRLIESMPDIGVVRSLLDKQRFLDNSGSVYRVISALQNHRIGAVNFCINQLGESYGLNPLKSWDDATWMWYCSQLVWAGYKNQGIDIDYDGGPTILPTDIVKDRKTYKVCPSC